MAERSPFLLLSLAMHRQRRQQEQQLRQEAQQQRQQEENNGAEHQHQGGGDGDGQQQQQQPQHQQHVQQQQQQRRTLSRQLSRRRSSSPILPVIHESFHESDSSPGSSIRSSSRSPNVPASALCNNPTGSFTSSSSSGASSASSSMYDNYNNMSHQIVWPPEDDASWPPSNHHRDATNNATNARASQHNNMTHDMLLQHQAHHDMQMINYGSIIESEDYISSSDSSSGSRGDDYEYYDDCDRRFQVQHRQTGSYRPSSSRGYRHLRFLVAAVFALSLSAASWFPLLQQQQQQQASAKQEQKYSDASSLPWGYWKELHDRYDSDDYDDDDDDDFVLFDSSSSRDGGSGAALESTSKKKNKNSTTVSSSTTSYYRHRHIDRDADESNWHRRFSTGRDDASNKDEAGRTRLQTDSGNSNTTTTSPAPAPAPGTSPFAIPIDITFADLAAVMLPPYFQRTVDLCTSTIIPATVTHSRNTSNITVDYYNVSTTSTMPWEVYKLRKTMLKTRDLLDVFSPVYSKHSSLEDYENNWIKSSMKHVSLRDGRGSSFELMLESDSSSHEKKKKNKKGLRDHEDETNSDDTDKKHREIKDLWKTLRRFLNDGYMLIGDFQDLSHAHIKYTHDQLADYQLKIWRWHERFMSFVQENRHIISLYLSLPCKKKHATGTRHANRCRHAHSHSSHLFWGNVTNKNGLPDGNMDGATSVLGRLGSSQLERAKVYLSEALEYDHVILTTVEEDAAAATNDVEVESGASPTTETTSSEDDGMIELGTGVHEVYHNLRKELRSFVDELDLFGHLLIPNTSYIPEIERTSSTAARSATSEPSYTGTSPPPLLKAQTDASIYAIKRTRKTLGDLNDDYVAYSAYVAWDEYPEEQARLRTIVEAQWSYFRIWAREVKLAEKMQFLRERMMVSTTTTTPSDEDATSESTMLLTSSLLGRHNLMQGQSSVDETYNLPNPTSPSLESFLMERKAKPTNYFVIGNDAGDADSIISAITLAYVESFRGNIEDATPIVSVSKDAFTHERPDINLLLQLAGMKDDISEHLLFIEDLKDLLDNANDDRVGSLPEAQSISLVDHNTLNKSLQNYQESLVVSEIVDHHTDEGRYKTTCTGNQRNIAFANGRALVASTTTLVAERLRDQQPPPYQPSVAILLLGVILLDSVNMDASIGKVTERDRDAVADLVLNTDWDEARPASFIRHNANGRIEIDTNDLFAKLQYSKYDPQFWDRLPVFRALGYDYKEMMGLNSMTFGISSILMPGLDFLHKEKFFSSTQAFMVSRKILFLGVMFAYYDEQDNFRRQLAFVSTHQMGDLHELVQTLVVSKAYNSVDLQLEEINIPTDELSGCGTLDVCLFNQHNVAPSRKQIGPMLENYFQE